jgi:hypothetical protein
MLAAGYVLALASWICAVVTAWSPHLPAKNEISLAIAAAAFVQPAFEGDDGVEKTAALLVGLALHESSFDPAAVGDSGRSHGLYQIQTSTAGTAKADLTDPVTSSMVAAKLIRQSLAACRALPLEERLAWYAEGRGACTDHPPSEKARAASRSIFQLARAALARRQRG